MIPKNTSSIGSIAILPLYWIAIVWLYHKGHTGALVDDGNAALIDFSVLGWKGILNNYGMTSLYYFHDLVNNVWFELFGTNTKAWFLLTASLHALNSWLIFINMKYFYEQCRLKHAGKISLFGSLLFLLSPYQSENIVWAATHHYGFALLFFMLMLRLILKIREETLLRSSIAIAVMYALSLLTREETLVFPGVFVIVFILLKLLASHALSVKRFFSYIVLPQAIFIVLYFVSTKLIKGNWIPHYGTTHIENISIDNYATTLLQYFVKCYGLVHFFDYPIREGIYKYIADNTAIVGVGFVLIAILLTTVLSIKNKRAAMVFGSLWLSTIVLFLPVLNLYFMYLFRYENDRMGYFGGIMLYQLFPLLFFSLVPILGYLFCLIYLVFALNFTIATAACWQHAGHFYTQCLSSLPQNNGRLFFLNVPLKYQSIYIFRSIERIRNAYQLYYNKDNLQQLKPVSWTLFYSVNDKLRIEKLSENSIKVIEEADGSAWWMHNEFGAQDYENDDCIFDVDEYGTGYTLTIKNPKPDDSFWITTPNGFQRYEFN